MLEIVPLNNKYLLGNIIEGEGDVSLGEALNVLLVERLDRLLHQTHITVLRTCG